MNIAYTTPPRPRLAGEGKLFDEAGASRRLVPTQHKTKGGIIKSKTSHD